MPSSSWSRRSFLMGGASAALVTACSGGKAASPTTTTTSRPPFTLISFSDPSALAIGSPARVTFGISDQDGVILPDAPVASLDFAVTLDGQPMGAPITSTSHAQGLPRPYFPVEFTPPRAGVYEFRSTVTGTAVPSASKTWVIPTFLPMIPWTAICFLASLVRSYGL